MSTVRRGWRGTLQSLESLTRAATRPFSRNESRKDHVPPPPEVATNVGTSDQQHVNPAPPMPKGHPKR